jgi:hypothetical protein
LSSSAITVERVRYPAGVLIGRPRRDEEGILVVAKARLVEELPYNLLSAASKDRVFPNDSTGDQWFDHRQFDAYTALGRYIGARAAAAMDVEIRVITNIAHGFRSVEALMALIRLHLGGYHITLPGRTPRAA